MPLQETTGDGVRELTDVNSYTPTIPRNEEPERIEEAGLTEEESDIKTDAIVNAGAFYKSLPSTGPIRYFSPPLSGYII